MQILRFSLHSIVDLYRFHKYLLHEICNKQYPLQESIESAYFIVSSEKKTRRSKWETF